MKHYNNYYVKFDDDDIDCRQILKEISNEEVVEIKKEISLRGNQKDKKFIGRNN